MEFFLGQAVALGSVEWAGRESRGDSYQRLHESLQK